MSEPNNLEHAKAQLLALQIQLKVKTDELERLNVEVRRLRTENVNLRHSMSIQDSNHDLRKNIYG